MSHQKFKSFRDQLREPKRFDEAKDYNVDIDLKLLKWVKKHSKDNRWSVKAGKLVHPVIKGKDLQNVAAVAKDDNTDWMVANYNHVLKFNEGVELAEARAKKFKGSLKDWKNEVQKFARDKIKYKEGVTADGVIQAYDGTFILGHYDTKYGTGVVNESREF